MARNLFEYHPVTGYRFIPGIRARVRHEGGGYLVHCNLAGFRCNHEVTSEKPAATYRILLFGDSYTAGEGVSNCFRFGDLLEDRLPGVQVLNFALPGSGTDQQYLTYREFAAGVECDLVLICPMVENIRRNPQSHRPTRSAFDGRFVLTPKPYFTLEHRELVLHHSPVPKGAVKLEGALSEYGVDDAPANNSVHRMLKVLTHGVNRKIPGFRAFTQRIRRISLPHEYNDPNDAAWLLMKAILAQWVAEADCDVLICPLPTFGHIEGAIRSEAYRSRFAEFSSEASVEVADILPHFQEKRRGARNQFRFEVDEHPTKLCHATIADALVPYINSRCLARKNR
jgi:hypothetical protein